MATILILNGPNLNLLGKREPDVYGTTSFEVFLPHLRAKFPHVTLHYVQSNHEGTLLDTLHEWGFKADGIIFNAGAYTHTSLALSDAIASITTPVIEVHLSNVYAREPIRHRSLIAGQCQGCITGFGLQSYTLAVHAFLGSLS